MKFAFDLHDSLYFNIGWYLLVPLLLGTFIGIQLDKMFNTKPVFTITFLMLGTISTFYNLWKLLNRK